MAAGNLRGRAKQTDFTKGPIVKPVVMFAIPAMLGNIFNAMYNVVDTIVVGQFVGSEIKLDGVDYKFVKQDDILAVVTD